MAKKDETVTPDEQETTTSQTEDEHAEAESEARTEKPTDEAVEKIIRRHVGFSMVAGAIPAPIVDIVIVTAIQMDMIRQLAGVYGVDYNEERGKSISASIMGATAGTLVGRVGASVVKAIPVVGWLLGIGSQVIFSGASTYALGKVFQSHFKKDGTMFDFNTDKMKDRFASFFERGKKVAENMRDKPSEDDIVATIEKLKELKDKGAISEDEFESSKKDLLDKLTQ